MLAFAVVVALVLLVIAAGQLGLLQGQTPADLGVRDGRLKPPSTTANSVSSQASAYEGDGAVYARIDPFVLAAQAAPQADAPAVLQADALSEAQAGARAGAQAMQKLKHIIESTRGAKLVQANENYIYAQFSTRWLRFTDDVEFSLSANAGVIHVRSASRLGRKDLGANRARIEAIREAFMATQR